jgi:hypothetical protein
MRSRFKPSVIMDWDHHPILLLVDGSMLPREMEMVWKSSTLGYYHC